MEISPPSNDLPPAPAADAEPSQTDPSAPDLPAIDVARLPGVWNAVRDDGSTFRFSLTADNKFTWKYSPPKPGVQEFSGTYTTDGAVLAFESNDVGALAGTVLLRSERVMNFKLVGALPEDPGLEFIS